MALILERNNMSAWKIHPDMRLLASIYGVLQVLSFLKFIVKPFVCVCVCVFTEISFVYYHTGTCLRVIILYHRMGIKRERTCVC